MAQCSIMTSTLLGVEALAVEVQVDVGPGLPSFSIVGLGDLAVQEARERVRAAVRASGFDFPNARVVVNLAPAPLRKHGTGFDLPIALALLVATGQAPRELVDSYSAVGEVALSGEVRLVPGMLAHAMNARCRGLRLLAAPGAPADSDLPGLSSRTIARLSQARSARFDGARPRAHREATAYTVDLSDVAGHDLAKRALLIAAAGAHNLLMVGPPGSGKTMLARRLPTIMPFLSAEERLESALVHSVAGLDEREVLAGVRPFRAPHHSATVAGLVGGGSPPRPGEASLAHNGVLFLDELAEFGPAALQTLRQPLEDGTITLVRAQARLRLPARFALVGAANPCPCGFLGDPHKPCTCTEGAVSKYHNRVGGPLLDRIDMSVRVDRVDPGRILDPRTSEACSANSNAARERVIVARKRAEGRGGPAAGLSGADLLQACALSLRDRVFLDGAARTFQLSGRGITRVLRVALTVADLEDSSRVQRAHLEEALVLRAAGLVPDQTHHQMARSTNR